MNPATPKHEEMDILKKTVRRNLRRCWSYIAGENRRTMFECLTHFHQELNPHSKAKGSNTINVYCHSATFSDFCKRKIGEVFNQTQWECVMTFW